MGRPLRVFFYMRRVERAVPAINTVPVVAGGTPCSATVATISAEELAVYIRMHSLEDQRSATTFTAGGAARFFPKGAAKTVTTTQTCWYSIHLCSSKLQFIDALFEASDNIYRTEASAPFEQSRVCREYLAVSVYL
jgi:hypothetical protein